MQYSIAPANPVQVVRDHAPASGIDCCYSVGLGRVPPQEQPLPGGWDCVAVPSSFPVVAIVRQVVVVAEYHQWSVAAGRWSCRPCIDSRTECIVAGTIVGRPGSAHWSPLGQWLWQRVASIRPASSWGVVVPGEL